MSKAAKPATSNLDAVWEKAIYGKGQQLNRYPFDAVVSFVFRNHPQNKPRSEVKILEIGCGAGNNLWFAAREGFAVAGIDGSPSVIDYARNRFAQDGLSGDLRIGELVQLPFDKESFDLVIDRAALTHSDFSAAEKTVAEVRRVLLPEGKFFFNPYSDRHSSYSSGHTGSDGLRVDISGGPLAGTGPVSFYGKRDVIVLFAQGWRLLSLQHVEILEEVQPQYLSHAEWRVTAQKVGQ